MSRPHAFRPFVAGVVLALTGLALAASPALAVDATPQPSETQTATVTVTVPSATPAPQNTRPGGNGGLGGNGGQNGGTQGDGGSPGGSGGSGGGTGPGTDGGTDPGTVAPTEPPLSKTPSTTADIATIDKTAYDAGDTITVTFGGFTPGEKVQVVLYPGPILIGNVDADAAGVATHTFQLPKDLAPGAHTVQMTGWASKKVAAATFVVASVAASAVPDMQGVPPWAWWSGGALLVLLAAAGAWWLVRTMRMPREVPAA